MYECLLLDGTQKSVDALNQRLKEGWGAVDRFEASTFIVVMLKKMA